MSERLPVPIRRVLREPFDEARLERARSQVGARTAPPRRYGWSAAIAAAVAVAAVVVAFVAASGDTARPGPLLLSSGRAVPATIAVEPAHGRAIAFDDGSEISLDATAVLRTLENDDREIAFLLDRGSVTFDVRPEGPRRWTIECGLASVVVVGTQFAIERTADRVRIQVTRGAVLVRGERVPDRARRLGAGESLVIQAEQPIAPPDNDRARIEVEERTAAMDVPTPEEAPRERPQPRPAPWRALVARSDWSGAYEQLGASGIERTSRTASIEELLELADIARLSGHPREAVAPLEQIVARHASDPSAALSAFSLGRVQDQLGHHDRAAHAFTRALELELPPSLRSDALARLANAHREAGDRAAALEAAARYLREFPDGRHAEAMRAIGAPR